MGAVWYRAATELRAHRRSTFAFAVVAGLIGAIVLAAIAGSRRTEHALASMVEHFNTPDIAVFVDPEAGPEVMTEVSARLRALPEVVAGIARRAGLEFGVSADVVVLAIGGVSIAFLITAAGALTGFRSARHVADAAPLLRPSAVGRALASLGVGPSTVVGARMALEPGRGATAVPVRSALLSAVLGVLSLTAAVTFASSLDRVVDEPLLRGWNWDYNVGNFSEAETAEEGRQRLLATDGIAELSGWQSDFVELEGDEVSLLMLDTRDGRVGPPVLEGRLPREPGEVSVGAATRRSLGVDLGDTVEAVGPSGEAVELRVVGVSVGTGLFDEQAGLDDGAVVTFDGVREMIDPVSGFDVTPLGFLVRLEPGEAGEQALRQIREDFPGAVYSARSTNDIENLRRVQWLPQALALLLALLGAATIAHAGFAAMSRRRHDLAILKALGFRRRDLSRVATAQSTSFVVVAVALGVPGGIIVGSWLWRLAAGSIGTWAGPVVPPVALLVGSLGALVIANAVSTLPGRAAARLPAAEVLRSE